MKTTRNRFLATVVAAVLAGGVVPGAQAGDLPDARRAAATVRGELVVALGMAADGSETRLFAVETDAGTVPLAAASADDHLDDVVSGSTVEVDVALDAASRAALADAGQPTAGLLPDAAAATLADAGPVTVLDADVLAPAAGLAGDAATRVDDALAADAVASTHAVHIVLAADAAAPGNVTETQARAAIASAAGFWNRGSRGKVADLAVASVRTVPMVGSCQAVLGDKIWDVWQQLAAAVPGVRSNGDNGQHLALFLPTSCVGSSGPVEWNGLATLGSSALASGGYLAFTSPNHHTVPHEFGHNFGLGHANLEVPVTGQAPVEYAGRHSPQSGSIQNFDGSYFTPPALDVLYQVALGVVPDAHVARFDLVNQGSVRLSPVDADGGVRLAVFRDAQSRLYGVEYRNGAGQDAGAFYTRGLALREGNLGVVSNATGVRVYRYAEGADVTTLGRIVDTGSGPTVRTALAAGESYTSPDGYFAVSVSAADGSGADVTVTSGHASTTKIAVAKARYGVKTKVKIAVSAPVAANGQAVVRVGRTVVARATVRNGAATAYLPASVKPGKRTVTVDFVGDGAAKSSSAARKITVAKGRPSIKVTTKNLAKGRKATVTVRLSKVSGTTPQGKVKLKVGKRTVAKAVRVTKVKGAWVARLTTARLPQGRLAVVYAPSSKNLAATSYTSKKIR